MTTPLLIPTGTNFHLGNSGRISIIDDNAWPTTSGRPEHRGCVASDQTLVDVAAL
jgi:hypothetical protein